MNPGLIAVILVCVCIVSCSPDGQDRAGTADDGTGDAERTPSGEVSAPDGAKPDDAAKAAFDACLRENMAVAMDWAVIEQNCREKTGYLGTIGPNTP